MNNPPTLDDDNPFSVYFSSNPKSSARSSSKDVKNPLDSKSRIEHYIKKFPLKGVLFCDFEDKVGPRIVKAYPNDIISDQEFLSISSKLLWRHQYSDNLSLLKQHKQQHQQKNNNHNSNLLDDKMEIETLSSQNSKNVGEKRPHYQSENGIFDVAVDRKKSKNSAKNSQIPTSSEINDNKIISVTTNSHKIISSCCINTTNQDSNSSDKMILPESSKNCYRNNIYYMFNFCLIVDKNDKSSPFVDCCKKITKFLLSLEQEDYLLSRRDLELDLIIEHIFNEINDNGRVGYRYLSQRNNYLKNQQMPDEPYQIILATHIGPFHIRTHIPEIYEVPFIWPHNRDEAMKIINSGNYDLPTEYLLEREIQIWKTEKKDDGKSFIDKSKFHRRPGIDNKTHILKLAHQVGMRPDIVCQVIADLRFYEVLTTVSIYQKTNRYRPTINISNLLTNNLSLQNVIFTYSLKDNVNIENLNANVQRSYKNGEQILTSSYPLDLLKNHSNLHIIGTILSEFHNDIPVSDIKKISHLIKIFKIIDLEKFTRVCEAYGLLKRVYDYPVLKKIGLDGSIKMDELMCHYAEWRMANSASENQNEMYQTGRNQIINNANSFFGNLNGNLNSGEFNDSDQKLRKKGNFLRQELINRLESFAAKNGSRSKVMFIYH